MTNRRHFLAAALSSTVLPAQAAFSADGPARERPGALKGVLLDVATAGARLVAVGERGHVLLSDDQGKTWRQAKGVPTRTTLAGLHATDAKTLWAAGHGGIILKSEDAGEHWALVTGKADGPDVLLAIRVDADGRGLAVGGFGVAMSTVDGGKTWKQAPLLGGEAGEKHLNRILVSGAGTWLIAAEGGHVLRADPTRATWTAVKTQYAGSLWSGLALKGGVLLVGGMRGNVVRSADDGLTWTHQPIAQAGSFTGGVLLGDGRPVLVGVDGTVVVGDVAGEKFTLTRLEDRATLTAAVTAGSMLIASSTAGMRTLDVPK
jgi:photosystem II stability/assembly factor-like uncharacterized protein